MVIADRNGDNLLHASLAGSGTNLDLSLDLLYDEHFQHASFDLPLLLLRYGWGVEGRFEVSSSSTSTKPTQSLEPGGFLFARLWIRQQGCNACFIRFTGMKQA
jgi:hypothetical protein